MRQVIINKQIRKEARNANIIGFMLMVGNVFYFLMELDFKESNYTNYFLFITNIILIFIFMAIMEVYFAIRIKDNDIEYIKK